MPSLTSNSDAKVMAKGQITIPKNIRETLGVKTGDRVVFIVEEGRVRVEKAAIFALKQFQEEMRFAAQEAGFANEQDAIDYITNSRRK